jgi:hypothetical protein
MMGQSRGVPLLLLINRGRKKKEVRDRLQEKREAIEGERGGRIV